MPPKSFCKVCKQIPFDQLRSEQEDAIPHHESLQDLIESCEDCPLCTLVYWAIGCVLAGAPGGMISFSKMTLPSGEQVMTNSMESNYSKWGSRAMENGAMMLDFSGAKADLREPPFVDPSTSVQDTKSVRPWLFGNWWKSPFPNRPPLLIGLGVRLGATPRVDEALGVKNDTKGEKTVHLNGTFLRIRTDEDAPLARMIPGRLRNLDQGSELAIRVIRDWIKSCESGHAGMCNAESRILPTRVLDVTDENVVKLIDSHGEEGSFVALSHSWGTSHRLTTTVSSLAAHKEGIKVDDLPLTFQQAVRITRDLGFTYLWIDSLCIIQDDPVDWEIEAAKMGQVYANSSLTISGLCSGDDSTGFFSTWETRSERPMVSSDTRSTGRRCIQGAAPLVKFEQYEGNKVRVYSSFGRYFGVIDHGNPDSQSRIYITPEWMPSSLTGGEKEGKMYLVGQFGGKFDPFEDEPLSKRGWTLQERLLSPRTLHFGTEEMFWECQSYVVAEDGALLERQFPKMKEILESRARKVSLGKHGEDQENQSSHRSWPDPWLQLVEKYSSRNLTREGDKLAAISGLAHTIANNTGDEYVAGIWRSDLLQGLLWCVDSFEPTHMCHDPEHDLAMPEAAKSTVKYPSEFRAPSWSWASLDAEISYKPLSREKTLATCIDFRVEAAGSDPFVSVSSGSLTVRGPLYLVNASKEKKSDTPAQHFTLAVELQSGKKNIKANAHFDSDIPQFPVFALFLDSKNGILLAQLSHRDESHHAFKRIGMVTTYDDIVPLDKPSSTAVQSGIIQPEPTAKESSKNRRQSWIRGVFRKIPKESSPSVNVADESVKPPADGSSQTVVIY